MGSPRHGFAKNSDDAGTPRGQVVALLGQVEFRHDSEAFEVGQLTLCLSNVLVRQPRPEVRLFTVQAFQDDPDLLLPRISLTAVTSDIANRAGSCCLLGFPGHHSVLRSYCNRWRKPLLFLATDLSHSF